MQSRWYTLLLVLAVIATSLVAFGALGVFFSALVLILACLLNRAKTVLRAILYFAAILLGIAFLLPLISCAREAARRMQCCNNLKQIALALHKYNDDYHCLPPACVYDKNGRPMHSWRVLILPYIEHKYLYEQYNLNEPWDGPKNRELLTQRPSLYKCPSDAIAWELGSTTTSYLAVVGSNTAWQRDKSVSLKDLESRDELSNTILVIETGDSGIQWSEPRDLYLDTRQGTEANPLSTLQGPHMRDNGYFYNPTTSAVTVAFADDGVRSLPAGILAPNNLQKLLAVGGCKEENVVYSPEELQINWYNCIVFAIWLVSIGLLLFWAVWTRRRQPSGIGNNVS
jgi:hypothetical protein